MYTPDDLTQERRIAAWRCDGKPAAYRTAAQRNAARMALRHETTYSRYVGILEPMVMPDGETVDYDEYLPSGEMAVEARVIQTETLREWRERLSDRARTVFDLLAQGWSKGEIAAHLHCSPAAVSRLLATIRLAYA